MIKGERTPSFVLHSQLLPQQQLKNSRRRRRRIGGVEEAMTIIMRPGGEEEEWAKWAIRFLVSTQHHPHSFTSLPSSDIHITETNM